MMCDTLLCWGKFRHITCMPVTTQDRAMSDWRHDFSLYTLLYYRPYIISEIDIDKLQYIYI